MSITPASDELLFLPLGGAGEIGMNLNLYGHAGKWLMIDLGITFGDERTPLVGRIVIAPFREHHVDPEYLGRKDFFDASSSNAWLAWALQGGWLWLSPPATGVAGVFAASFVLSFSTWVFLTNTFHQWAHQPAPPRVARVLRRLRLAITPEQHALHHRAGDRAYCVATGWCNAALERWRVFERLERWAAPLRSGSRSRRPSDA